MIRAPADRGQGRKAMPAADRAAVRSVRLTAAQWDKFRALGGVVWLRAALARARWAKK